MIIKRKKGGKVIASGGFGCVFSPALLCNKTKKRRNNFISKLMGTKYAYEEYNEINEIRSKLQNIANYNNYFLLQDVSICKPAKLTKQDLKNYNKNCTALPKENITLDNINSNIDKLMSLNMPNAGLPIDDFIMKYKKFQSIFQLNVKLIELLQKGIVPMNNKNVYHNDIKDSNILVDYNDVNLNNMYTRLIDWGLSTTYVPFANTNTNTNNKIPSCWRDRPLQYNTPFSVILFSSTFVQQYTIFINQNNGQPMTSENVSRFVLRYLDFWLQERGQGHYKLICKIINILSNENPKNYIANYITNILLRFTKLNQDGMIEYLDTVFIHNVDKWGFVTTYFPILHIYHTNHKLLDKETMNAFDTLKELFNYTYTTSSEKLNVDTISTNAASIQNYNNTGPLLVNANQLYAGVSPNISNLYKNKAPGCNSPTIYPYQNKKICSYRKLPQYQVPASQPSPYRYLPTGNIFSSNHFSQSPNTYNTTSGSAAYK